MKKNKNKKVEIVKYLPGELVVVQEGMHYYHNKWATDNGLLPGKGRFFTKKVLGVYIKNSPESGNLYKLIEIENELFEIFHKQIEKKYE